MNDALLKVCVIRTDGVTHDTTFQGYGAETCALNYFASMTGHKTTQYVCIIYRYKIGDNSDIISWETSRFYQKEKPLSVD